MCYGIVRQADGLMLVESEPGRGARFSVLLPREGSDAEERVAPAVPARRDARVARRCSWSRTTRPFESVTGRILQELGYTVLEAGSAAEARSVAASGRGSDRSPAHRRGHAGRQRTRAGGRDDPDPSGPAVVFMSGYTADVILRQGIVHDKVTLLSKPFTADALADTLRKALDRTGQPG